VRELLKKYLDQRVLFYTTRNQQKLAKINSDTAELQKELWSAVRSRTAQPTPLVALAISGMNDVLNSQGYTQAAWWNRIPTPAGVDGNNRFLLQLADWVRRAAQGRAYISDPAVRGVHSILADCRH
jgi:hypothetical protein